MFKSFVVLRLGVGAEHGSPDSVLGESRNIENCSTLSVLNDRLIKELREFSLEEYKGVSCPFGAKFSSPTKFGKVLKE